VLPADSLPTTNVRGFGRWAGGDRRVFLAAARKLLREARGGAMAADTQEYGIQCEYAGGLVGIQNRKCKPGCEIYVGILQMMSMTQREHDEVFGSGLNLPSLLGGRRLAWLPRLVSCRVLPHQGTTNNQAAGCGMRGRQVKRRLSTWTRAPA
jgi:hypothetical protein